jgi:transcription termination/antitermination protein NusG
MERDTLPLFTGYVFCRIQGAGAAPMLLTPGVIRVIGTSKCPSVIPEHEIAAIQLAMKSGYSIQPCDYVEVGSRVRIVGGPLDGVEGLVESHRNQHRLVLSVEPIRGSVVVELGGYAPLDMPVLPVQAAPAA